MTLNEYIAKLQELQAQGHGGLRTLTHDYRSLVVSPPVPSIAHLKAHLGNQWKYDDEIFQKWDRLSEKGEAVILL